MAIKLFPNLERIKFTEHAKSNNYEDYIGVVLDKRNNNFKVVEGKFTDKKDMYRKMKARGLILRKAYERKVWKWIAENADGPIVSYLMLSTAFSKWRSNNVLHKYYQKLLNDIPELNREREKGNPNTRGGDFITTDDEPAPKRQDESVELEEERRDYNTGEKHIVELLGVENVSEKQLTGGSVVLPKDIIKEKGGIKHLYNRKLLDLIKEYLVGENPFNIVKLILKSTAEISSEEIFIKIDLNRIEKLLDAYENAKETKRLKTIMSSENVVTYDFKLLGIVEKEYSLPFTANHVTNSKVEMPILLNNRKQLKDPVITDVVYDYLITKNIQIRSGKSYNFDKVFVKIDGDVKKVYDKASVKSDKIEIEDGVVAYGISNAANANLQIDPLMNTIRSEIIDTKEDIRKNLENIMELKKEIENLKNNSSKKSKKKIEENETEISNCLNKIKNDRKLIKQRIKELKLLILKKQDIGFDENANLSYERGTWQTKAISQLQNDSEESRIEMSENKCLTKFLGSLTSSEEVLEEFNEHIKNKINGEPDFSRGQRDPNAYKKDDRMRNTSYRSKIGDGFIPLTKKELEEICLKIELAQKLSENKDKRISLLRTLIWYVQTSNEDYKSSHKKWSHIVSDQALVDEINSVAERIGSTKLTGFNYKTQNGRLDSEEDVMNLSKLRKKLESLLDEADKKHIKINKEEYKPFLSNEEKPFEYTGTQPEFNFEIKKDDNNKEVEKTKEYEKSKVNYNNQFSNVDVSLPKNIENEITNYVYDKYNKIVDDEISNEKRFVFNKHLTALANDYVNSLSDENIDRNAEIEKYKSDPLNIKKVEDYYDKSGGFTKEDIENRKNYLLKTKAEDISKEINKLKQNVESEKKGLEKGSNASEDELYKTALNNIIGDPVKSVSKKEAVQVTQYDNDGATLMHRYSPYQGKGFDYSAGPIKMTGQIVEDTTKTELNPKLFENDVLIPEVRDALYKIATVFKDYLDLPFEIKDIYFTGSNANYNYNEDSDIDLHLVYDFEQAGVNAELLSKYLVAAKKDFNDKYDIKVKGMPVELGCENVNEPLVSTGVYSLGANTWVIKPENSGIEIPDVDMNAFNDLSTQIDDTIKNQNASAIEKLWKKIKELRKNSLADEGEFGMGNLLFKKLRNTDYLEKLRNKMYDTQSKELSLESSDKLDEAELNDKRDVSEYLKDLKDELETKETQDLLSSKSLIKYLDGYKDKNDKSEVKNENGFLNEDIKTSAIKRALRYEKDSIPSDINHHQYFDLDDTICYIDYKPKEGKILKYPAKRVKGPTGSMSFKPTGKVIEITYEEMEDILNYNKNVDRYWNTPIYDDHEEISGLLTAELNKRDSDFNQWCNDNEEDLNLKNFKKKNGREALKDLYNYSVKGNMSNKKLKEIMSTFYNESYSLITEDGGVLSTSNTDDLNKINRIFKALGLNPDYMTRYIYEYGQKYDHKQRGNVDFENLWKITGIDDISKYINEDGSIDLQRLPCKLRDVKIYMRDVTKTGSSAQNRSVPFGLDVLDRLIKNFSINDIESDDDKIEKDVLSYSSSSADRVRSNTQSTYSLEKLTDNQVKKALDYVQSDEVIKPLERHCNVLKRRINSLDLNDDEDKKLYSKLMREFRFIRRELIYLKFGGDGKTFAQLYDEITPTHMNYYDTILFALNCVQNGIKIFPRKLVNDRHGVGFYIKLPKEGHTIEEIQNHGSFEPTSVVQKLRKMNGGV